MPAGKGKGKGDGHGHVFDANPLAARAPASLAFKWALGWRRKRKKNFTVKNLQQIQKALEEAPDKSCVSYRLAVLATRASVGEHIKALAAGGSAQSVKAATYCRQAEDILRGGVWAAPTSTLQQDTAYLRFLEHDCRGADDVQLGVSPLTFVYDDPSVALLDGMHLEFGVARGTTLRLIADRVRPKTAYGFDSFEGLPENWRKGFSESKFDRGGTPPTFEQDNIECVVGWFEDTLPGFFSRPDIGGSECISVLHIDCDLYSSTRTVFR